MQENNVYEKEKVLIVNNRIYIFEKSYDLNDFKFADLTRPGGRSISRFDVNMAILGVLMVLLGIGLIIGSLFLLTTRIFSINSLSQDILNYFLQTYGLIALLNFLVYPLLTLAVVLGIFLIYTGPKITSTFGGESGYNVELRPKKFKDGVIRNTTLYNSNNEEIIMELVKKINARLDHEGPGPAENR